MLIHGSKAVLSEVESLLRERGVQSERGGLIANSVDAGIYEILKLATAASIPLVAQALITFITRKRGQRKVVVQWIEPGEDHLKRVEVETPRLDEVQPLLEKARDVFAVDSTVDGTKT
jgi:hypothetical protein